MSQSIQVRAQGSGHEDLLGRATLWAGRAGLGLVGVFVEPLGAYCGLRAWDDAPEDVLQDGTPAALFDVEKFARMLLHQTVVGFDVLVASDTRQLELRSQLGSWALTQHMPMSLLECAEGALQNGWSDSAIRYASAAWALANHGIATGDATILTEILGTELGTAATTAETVVLEAREAIVSKNVLPPSPTGYDQLNEWVVATRLRDFERS